MKSSTCLRAAFAIGLLALQTAIPAQAATPTVVLGFKNIDEILDDADFIAEAAGHEGLKDFVETNIEGLTGGMGLAGVDRERPLGLYWSLLEEDIDSNNLGTVVVFIPISDRDKFEKLVKKFVPDLKSDDGLWSMSMNGLNLFAKFSNDFCFISTSETGLTNLAEPEKIVNDNYDISVEVNIASIPQKIKDTYLGLLEESAKNGLDDQPEPATQAEAAGRKVGFDLALGVFTSIVQDGDRFTLGLDVDSETRMVTFDTGFSGKTNTRLGNDLALFGQTKPAFAVASSRSAPFQLVMSLPTSGLVEKSDELMNALRQSATEEIEKDPSLKDDAEKQTAKDVANRMIEIMKATIDSGSLHTVLVMEQGDGQTVRVVGGAKVAKGDDASQLVDDLVKLAKDSPDLARFKLDAAKHAGARIHAISPELTDKQVVQFGKDPAHLAIRGDSIWLSLGGGNLDALKTALDSSTNNSSKSSAPISLHLKPAALVKLIQMDDSELLQHAEGLVGEPGDVLNIELAPQEKTGIKLHIEFGIDLLRLGVLQVTPEAE